MSRRRGQGGNFSHSYLVEKDGSTGFLKAFDFSHAFEDGRDTIALLNLLTSAYEHDREILQICKERRLSNVVIAIDHGYVQVPGMAEMDGRVYYLIFKMADGDIRGQVNQTKRFDTLWAIRALKDVCLGLCVFLISLSCGPRGSMLQEREVIDGTGGA